MSLTERLTDGERLDIERRLAEIAVNPAYVFGECGVLLAACRRLLAEIDALRAERDDLKRQTRLWWQWCSVVDRLPAECPPYREPTPG